MMSTVFSQLAMLLLIVLAGYIMRKTNILLIIIAIELFIMVVIDSIRYVYIVDYTFICMSALIIALVILKRNKKFKRKCDNSKNDESNKGNSIIKKIIKAQFQNILCPALLLIWAPLRR